jgi:outer membrane protein OmpA-like peptidoglycan-associated protein
MAGTAAGGREGEQSNHAAAFLRAGVDARHLGMGGVGAALAEGVPAGYWNPAGLARFRGFGATAMVTQKLDFDRRHSFAAAAWGAERLALGLSWISAGTDDIPGADASDQATGEFAFSENALLASAAVQAGSASAGLSVKLITQNLGTDAPGGGDDTALGYGVDVGAQYSVTQFARVGLVIQDIFAEVGDQDVDGANDVPANLRFGLALEPVDGFVLSSDLEKTRDDDDYRFHGGAEFLVPVGANLSTAARLGIREGRFSGGFGAQIGSLRLDYAYVIEPESFLGENHRFSLTLHLGTERELIREGDSEDRDFDGFGDEQDDCPDAPEDFDSFEDFDGCPDADNDEDGLLDLDDLCPDEAEDEDGFQDDDGCPDADNDGDGILDDRDECPDQGETFNAFEDEDGCPDEVAFEFGPVYVHFAPGSAAFSPAQAEAALEAVERALRQQPDLRLEIQGHTDDRGGARVNQRLSERRAQAVKDFLVARGIEPHRLLVRGFGETRPLVANDTESGRAENRRIEVVPIP